jgi:uncharacterized protein YccT (UPF0319 family)
MKNIILLILVLFIFQSANAQTSSEILPVLRERGEVGKTNQSIAVAVIDKKESALSAMEKRAARLTRKTSMKTRFLKSVR